MRVWFNKTFSNIHAVLELIRHGDTAGEFELICSHNNPHFPGFQAAHEHALEPLDSHGEAYIEFCLDFCERHRIEVFAPGRELITLGENAARFAARGVRLLATASPQNLRLLHDKAGFYTRATHNSPPPPEFCAFDDIDGFDVAYAALRARHSVLCVKPAEGVFGVGFRIIDEQRQGLDLMLKGDTHRVPLADLRQLLAEAESLPTLLLMEYLDGFEYSADCVGDGARLIECVQRRKPLDGRYGQEIVDSPPIRRACAELTQEYGLQGLFNVQFRDGRDGLRLLEVNPRLSGGIAMSCAAGINLPYLALRGILHGFDDYVPAPPTVGVRVLEIPRAQCLGDRDTIPSAGCYLSGAPARAMFGIIAMNDAHRVELKTGVLIVEVFPGAAFPFDELCTFAARNNRKRGFLFVSKVLGKHWPVTPSVMRGMHAHLAALISPAAAPTVFIGMAETATGLGHGVFDAFLAQHPDHKALFLHTTRYRMPGREFLGFEERHTHAPDLYLYRPLREEHDALFRTARTLVLIDDEISTGSTLCNLARAYKTFNPNIERVFFTSITDFSGTDGAARFTALVDTPVQCVSALRGAFQFQPGEDWPVESAPPAVGDNRLVMGAVSDRLGRFGISAPVIIPARDIDGLALGHPAARVLVLGTGEFMHPAFRVGLALEARGFAVSVQATTRSPLLLGAGISQRLVFPDNYGEGVGNYLYNVTPIDYDLCVICHETPVNEGLRKLAEQLGSCVFYYS